MHDLTKLIDSIRPFPEAQNVFAAPVDRYRKYLQPLLSIDLALCNPDWRGLVHLLSPIEPYDGYLGERTIGAHTQYCRMNWLGFKIDAQHRYHLLSDFDFFELDSIQGAELDPDLPDYSQELANLYEEAERSFAGFQDRFARFGGLYAGKRFKPAEKNDPDAEAYAWLSALGGKAPDGNWADGSNVFNIIDDPARGLVPSVRDGDDFHFVASTRGYHYRKSAADEILLFYSPSQSIVLQTFDWS
jgi:hypothetical protein